MKDEGKRQGARRTILTGLLLVAGCGLVVLSPLVLRTGSVNRYLVAFGLVGVLLGGSFLLNGSWDWLAERRRR